MLINSHDLYNAAKLCWRDALHLNSKNYVDPDLRHLDLNKIYRVLESRMEGEGDWQQLAVWAFYQSLHELTERGENFRKHVRLDDVTYVEFDRKMKFNLSDDAWSELRGMYR
jgi:hypothetical protein